MDSPELTNFGSVVRFALRLEEAAAAFYESLARDVTGKTDPGLPSELAAQHRDRCRILERTRAQVNEMTLEPIADLDGRRYLVDARSLPGPEGIRRGVALEETAARFYSDASVAAKAVLAEAARTFRKFGEESARNAVRLRTASFGGGATRF